MVPPKVQIKIEIIARLRAAAILSDQEIADKVGLTRSGLSRILALPEYKMREAEVLNTATESYDKALSSSGEALRRRFEVAVPIAMRGLLETAQQRGDLKSRVTACMELLDRDHRRLFVKPSVAGAASQGGSYDTALSDKVLSATVVDADLIAAAQPPIHLIAEKQDGDANGPSGSDPLAPAEPAVKQDTARVSGPESKPILPRIDYANLTVN